MKNQNKEVREYNMLFDENEKREADMKINEEELKTLKLKFDKEVEMGKGANEKLKMKGAV